MTAGYWRRLKLFGCAAVIIAAGALMAAGPSRPTIGAGQGKPNVDDPPKQGQIEPPPPPPPAVVVEPEDPNDPKRRWRPVDMLVIAPHPDDETLGCGAIIVQALKSGRKVHVIVMTNGDGFPAAVASVVHKSTGALNPNDYVELARVRQLETYKAISVLGLKRTDVTFLGYPDSALLNTFESRTVSVVQKYNRRAGTYALPDQAFHNVVHGEPAPYRRQSVVGDLTELLQMLQPKQIYVTDPLDEHRDHQASYYFIKEAAQQVGYLGVIRTYLIHVGSGLWPYPHDVTPLAPFQAHNKGGVRVPHAPIVWPPPIRVPVTEQEALQKLRAIEAYPTQIEATDGRVGWYVKSEEIFWYGDYTPPMQPHQGPGGPQ